MEAELSVSHALTINHENTPGLGCVCGSRDAALIFCSVVCGGPRALARAPTRTQDSPAVISDELSSYLSAASWQTL